MKLAAIGALVALSGLASAATITISAGFGASQGINVFNSSSVALTNYAIAVGSWNGTSFTQFGTTQVDAAAPVNGSVTAVSPGAVNGQIIHLFVGSGSTVDFNSPYALLKMNSNLAFPADVSSGTATATFNTAVGTNLTLVSSKDMTWNPQGASRSSLTVVPEPSAALLGALGALGLLRRRRA